MTIWVVGLPFYDTRPWKEQIGLLRRFLNEDGYKYQDDVVIVGNQSDLTVAHSEFMDYKYFITHQFMAMQEVINNYVKGDTIFFMDGECPGAEAFEYIQKMSGDNIKINMYWHAGTYDTTDLTAIRGVKGVNFEKGWFDIADKIFVGTNFHKKLLNLMRGVDLDKIYVTGEPFDFDMGKDKFLYDSARENFIFGGRLSNDKGYDVIKKLRAKGYNIYATMEHNLSKIDYLGALFKAKLTIVPSRHEMFGIVPIESVIMGTPVIASDIGAYKDYLPKSWLYEDEEDLQETLEDIKNEVNLARYSHSKIMQVKNKMKEKYDYRKVWEKWLS